MPITMFTELRSHQNNILPISMCCKTISIIKGIKCAIFWKKSIWAPKFVNVPKNSSVLNSIMALVNGCTSGYHTVSCTKETGIRDACSRISKPSFLFQTNWSKFIIFSRIMNFHRFFGVMDFFWQVTGHPGPCLNSISTNL